MMQGMILDRRSSAGQLPPGNLRRATFPIISIGGESSFFLFHADGLCTA
jgi:hypothetical protein